LKFYQRSLLHIGTAAQFGAFLGAMGPQSSLLPWHMMTAKRDIVVQIDNILMQRFVLEFTGG
jgi:hypothetical protein